MSLSEHRQAIDKLDAQIVRLLNERTRHVLAIGEIKLAAGEEIYAPHRERAVFDRVCALNAGPITDQQLRAIYREIMSSALALEKTMTIAYFGPEATFTHQAALQKFGASLNYAAQKTIGDVFMEVSKRAADYGVVPVENSTEGVVTHTLDMFADSDLKIVSQILLQIQQCLMSNSPLSKIKKLYVHPQSLAQCRGWLANIVQRALGGTRREGKILRGARRRAGGGKIWPGNSRKGYPGQHRQRHALHRAGPPMQPAHGRRPHEPDGKCGRPRGRTARGHRRIPQVQDQPDENRVAPQQTQGVGIFFLH
jgi:chorismate mutase / prephenate dehydratase